MSEGFHALIGRMESFFVSIAEKGFMPDALIRFGVRNLLNQTLDQCRLQGQIENQQKYLEEFIQDLKIREIAEQTKDANKQHYEVPTELYLMMLGPWLKYSSGLWPNSNTTLEESETAMLDLVIERAEIKELPKGASVLDLGCGWGSFALYVASKFPDLKITCISNSTTQREFILNRCSELGIQNLTAKTADINVMEFKEKEFDRVCSTEMFEHMKNYEKLLAKIERWLKPKGKLFVHMFTHRRFSYHYTDGWMAENFFTGGTMPGQNLLLRFNKNLSVEKQWAVNGIHYSKTLEAWLKKIDQNQRKFLKICAKIYGEEEAQKWLFNWRLFHIASSECFNMNNGNEWFVSHYRFIKSSEQ